MEYIGKTLNSDTERFPCTSPDHNSLINGRNIIISIGILIGRNIIRVFIRISIQTAKIKIRLADRACIGEAKNRVKTKQI